MRNLILLTLGLLISASIYAQPDNSKHRKAIEAYRIAYMTKNLDLSPQEAEKFWPVYNQMQKEMKVLRQQKKTKMQEMRTSGNEGAMADYEIAHKQKELDLVKKHHESLKQTIPPHKVSRLYNTERNFRQDLMQKMQQQRQNNPNARPNRGPQVRSSAPKPRTTTPAVRPASPRSNNQVKSTTKTSTGSRR